MIAYFRYTFLLGIAVVTGFTTAQAFAQAPSDAQRSAIKSACRSDYMAHCSSVQPGGAAALQCLQKNMASLSSACQTAVKAVSPAADAKPAAAPAIAEASKATEAKAAAARPAAEATMAATAAAAAPQNAVAVASPAMVLRPLRPLEEVRIVNAACGADARAFCSAVEPGGGRVARCLATNAASLSSACRSMLAQFAAR